MSKRAFLSLTLLLIAFTTTPAQNIKFYAQVDRIQVYLDEQFTLTLSLEGDVGSVPRPKFPALTNFVVYESGRSQNFSYVNGQVSSSINFNYILMPRQAGKFTIPPVAIELQGNTYHTNPIEITVLAGQSRGEPLRKDQLEGTKQAQDLWIETSIDKKTAYVGEQVTLTLKFYQGVRLFQNPEYTPPSLTGFWTEDLPPQKRYYQNIGNRRYYVQEIKTALFPTTSGKKTIGAAELKCRIEDLETFLGRDPFAFFDKDLSQLFSQGKPKVLRSQPLSLEVLSLPAGQPANFNGAVGKFSLKTELDKTEVEVGQPATLKITISGVGNVRSITTPPLPDLSSFRAYNSSNSENISKANYQLQGTKTFEQILIPKEPGTFTIPPVEFSYFDVAAQEYKTLKSPSYTLTVRSGSALPLASLPTTTNEISAKVKDIHYLKTELGQVGKKSYVIQSPFFLTLQLVPVLALVLLWRKQAQKEKLLSNRTYARYRLAYKNAQKNLELTRQSLVLEPETEFYSNLYKTLSGYLADKLDLDYSNLFTEELMVRLKESTLPTTELNQIKEVLEMCDQARFGGAKLNKNRKLLLLELTENLIKCLERLRWNGKVKATI